MEFKEFYKWFNKQSVLLKVILLVIPFVGWVVELLVRGTRMLDKKRYGQHRRIHLVRRRRLGLGLRSHRPRLYGVLRPSDLGGRLNTKKGLLRNAYLTAPFIIIHNVRPGEHIERRAPISPRTS